MEHPSLRVTEEEAVVVTPLELWEALAPVCEYSAEIVCVKCLELFLLRVHDLLEEVRLGEPLPALRVEGVKDTPHRSADDLLVHTLDRCDSG